jgi:hypothetical protein
VVQGAELFKAMSNAATEVGATTTYKLTSSAEDYWNLADIATYKNGVRTNLHAPCTASSSYLGRNENTWTEIVQLYCDHAFNGIVSLPQVDPADGRTWHGWSPIYYIDAPGYWIQWEAPADADTLKIYQSGHEHSSATLMYNGKPANWTFGVLLEHTSLSTFQVSASSCLHV